MSYGRSHVLVRRHLWKQANRFSTLWALVFVLWNSPLWSIFLHLAAAKLSLPVECLAFCQWQGYQSPGVFHRKRKPLKRARMWRAFSFLLPTFTKTNVRPAAFLACQRSRTATVSLDSGRAYHPGVCSFFFTRGQFQLAPRCVQLTALRGHSWSWSVSAGSCRTSIWFNSRTGETASDDPLRATSWASTHWRQPEAAGSFLQITPAEHLRGVRCAGPSRIRTESFLARSLQSSCQEEC